MAANIVNLQEASQLQLAELDMLQSMYSNPKELVLDDPTSVSERHSYIDGNGECKQVISRLDYSINLIIEQTPVSFEVSLPPLYPFVRGDMVIRCSELTKQSLLQLNEALKVEMETIEEGDICIGVLLSWLNEVAPDYIKNTAAEKKESGPSSAKLNDTKKNEFCRMWVYSHHIYSQVKRKDLLDLSVEYDLTGFILPGKPGLICVEGWRHNTIAWWSVVRSWNWQKILCKRQETEDLAEGSSSEDLLPFRRFKSFHELGTGDEIKVKGGGYHVDMGDLYRYLKKHHSEYMFKEYFGVEGRDS